MGQSLRKVQTCLTVYRRLLLHRRNPSVVFAAAACCSEAWLTGRTSSRSPFLPSPPGRCRPTPCHTRSSPEGICIRGGRYRPLIGQVRTGRPQGSPTNGDSGCVTHRERTSCSTILLLFSAPNSSHCIVSSFFFKPSSSSSSTSLSSCSASLVFVLSL